MVNIKNVYWMLAYAFDTLKEKGTQSIKTEDFDNIYDMLSAILVKALNYQVKKGLNREYVTNTDVLSGVKGKILISDSIKYNTLKDHKLMCEYDEFSINSYMNKIIKSTLMYLVKTDKIDIKYRSSIKKLLVYFKEVELIEFNSVSWTSIKYDRNNVTYRMIMNVCYLIIEGLILTNQKGENKLTEFIDEQKLSALYEKFVRAYYIKHFPSLHAKAMHIDWNIEEESVGLLPNMKTDITLTYKDKTLIIDTKCYEHTLHSSYLSDKKTIISNHAYQIFAYVKNKDVDNTGNISGMMLYAKTDEEEWPDQTNYFGKNKITFKTLDLTKDFEYVSEQLDEIAKEFTNLEVGKIE